MSAFGRIVDIAMRASRLLSILMTLQSRGRVSARELAERFEVSKRTIYRDVDELAASGVPIYADRGARGGFALRAGYRTELTGLDAGEAEALLLAGLPAAAADLGLAEPASLARLKLLSALPEAAGQRARRVADRFHLDPSDWYRRPASPPQLAPVARAVWEAKRLRLVYESWNCTAPRVVEPLGIVLKSGEWYLLAGSGPRARIYRLRKMHTVTVLDEAFERPSDFVLPQAWRATVERFEAGLRRGSATLRVAPDVSSMLERLPADIVEPLLAATPDARGHRTAVVPIESIEFAAAQLLTMGDGVEVLEPVALRDAIVARASRVLALYAPAPTAPPKRSARQAPLRWGSATRRRHAVVPLRRGASRSLARPRRWPRQSCSGVRSSLENDRPAQETS